MRLLRLTTENENAIFDATFNEDFIIPKDAKIALQNVSVEAKTDSIVIDSQNNTMTYQVSDYGQTQIRLNYDTYSGVNATDLFNDIQNKLNANTGFDQLLANRRELGMEWKAGLNDKKKMVIEYDLGEVGEFPDYWEYDSDDVQRVATAGGLWSKKDGVPAGSSVEANMVYPYFIARGCGFTRGKIYTLENPDNEDIADSGFLIGLSNILINNNDDLELGNITYGLRVNIDAGGTRSYGWIENGVETPSAETVGYVADGNVDNDFIEIEINNGKVRANCYKVGDAGLPTVIKEWDYSAGQELYPVNVFFGKRADARMSNVRVTDSPYNSFDLKGDNNNPTELHAPPIPQRNAGPNFFDLGSISLAEFLNYSQQRYPLNGTTNLVSVAYPATNAFNPKVVADAFLIELLNIPLDSFDSFVKQRKNLLAVVPASDNSGFVIYEPSTPFFIDVKNQSDLLLRNIRARIVNTDYTPFEMKGLATLTLLIS